MIIFYLPNYIPEHNAGDTLFAHAIVTYLQSKGWEVQVMLPSTRNTRLLREAELVVCQLDTTVEAVKLAKRVIWIQHNTFPYPTVENNPKVSVIYNGEASMAAMGWSNDGFVLTPPVDLDYYAVTPGDCVTLINCNENKGGNIVHEIAKRMPHIKFLQVLGAYGTQYVSTNDKEQVINIDNKPLVHGLGYLPNVEVLPHQTNIREVYKRTRILLMPSAYESWGRTATEAMCSGIPVICNPTFGLKENCQDSCIFVERDNINQWVMEIEKLQGKKEYTKASKAAKKRAMELNPEKKLEKLEQWIKKKIYGIQHHS